MQPSDRGPYGHLDPSIFQSLVARPPEPPRVTWETWDWIAEQAATDGYETGQEHLEAGLEKAARSAMRMLMHELGLGVPCRPVPCPPFQEFTVAWMPDEPQEDPQTT